MELHLQKLAQFLLKNASLKADLKFDMSNFYKTTIIGIF